MNDNKNHTGGMAVLRSNGSVGSKWTIPGQSNELSDDITDHIITLVAINSDRWREFMCAG